MTPAGRVRPSTFADLYGASVEDIVLPVAVLPGGLLWLGIGFWVVVAVMRRGGVHGPWSALLMALGPAGWALRRSAPPDPAAGAVEVAPGTVGRGHLSVLVAVLGRSDGVADADRLLRKIGREVREIVLVRPAGGRAAEDAARALSEAALFVWQPEPRQVVVPGHGATAVARFAAAYGPDVVVVVGGPAARAALRRCPQLRDRTVVRASQAARPGGVSEP